MIQFRSTRPVSIFVLAALTLGHAGRACLAYAEAPPPLAPRPAWAQATSVAPMEKQAKLAQQYVSYAQRSVGRTLADMPRISAVGEKMAQRYADGGEITLMGQGLPPELSGRSGGFMNFTWDAKRSAAQKANDIALVGWERAPSPAELEQLKLLRAAGTYIVGFGPRHMSELAAYVPLCDVWFDSGLGADDRVVKLPNGSKAGRANLLVTMLNSWSVMGEFVAGMTRRGLMPVMWKSFMYLDGRAWGEAYSGKTKYHTDYEVPSIPAGQFGRAFLAEMRINLIEFERTQLANIAKAAEVISLEVKDGKKVPVAFMGHAPSTYVGKYEDSAWIKGVEIGYDEESWDKFVEGTPENAVVVRLGYTGIAREEAAAFKQKNMRVVFISTLNPYPDWTIKGDEGLFIDMGWRFGDAAVGVPGYPVHILPPSGIMQIVAYEAINVEVLGSR